jgi:hypothetical protein
MKILLDECVPWPLHKFLTVQQSGWGGIKNGDLMRLAEKEFDLFTSDQNIRYQQNLAGRQIAILELSTNDLRRIQVAGASIQSAIEIIQPREFRRLEIPF